MPEPVSAEDLDELVQRCRELIVELDGLSERADEVDLLAGQQFQVAARHVRGARETLERAGEDDDGEA